MGRHRQAVSQPEHHLGVLSAPPTSLYLAFLCRGFFQIPVSVRVRFLRVSVRVGGPRARGGRGRLLGHLCLPAFFRGRLAGAIHRSRIRDCGSRSGHTPGLAAHFRSSRRDDVTRRLLRGHSAATCGLRFKRGGGSEHGFQLVGFPSWESRRLKGSCRGGEPPLTPPRRLSSPCVHSTPLSARFEPGAVLVPETNIVYAQVHDFSNRGRPRSGRPPTPDFPGRLVNCIKSKRKTPAGGRFLF